MTSPSTLSSAVNEQNHRLTDFLFNRFSSRDEACSGRLLGRTKSHPSVQLTLFTMGDHSVAIEKDAQTLHQEKTKKFS